MSIYLRLFLTFLEIGAVSFGGGYGMIALVREKVLANGWLTEEAFLDFIAVSESTPGPIAINMATFIGSSQAGFFGAVLATLGVVLPSFLIILLLLVVFRRLLASEGCREVLKGVRPAVIALIVGTGATMLLSTLFSLKTVTDALTPDWRGIGLFALIAVLVPLIKKKTGKKISGIFIILFSAAAGIVLYGLL